MMCIYVCVYICMHVWCADPKNSISIGPVLAKLNRGSIDCWVISSILHKMNNSFYSKNSGKILRHKGANKKNSAWGTFNKKEAVVLHNRAVLWAMHIFLLVG